MEFENIQSFDLTTCIGSKVMRISRITAKIFRKYLRPFNITGSQLTVLFILAKREGLTQKRLCEIAQLEKSSLNRNLKRLFEKRYLSRKEFPIINITDEGKSLVNTIIPEWEKAMKEIRQILGEDGEDALDMTLTKLMTKKA
ncbi:MAG: hypothetical protein COA57_13875 [Flavobacteriales bacterium]|nr:MAG: hypothetical protein COA57_13875 [Flavobacteriales bacterium]